MAGFKEIIGHKREIAHLTKAMEAGKVLGKVRPTF